jgi:hypothetical protein
MVECISLKTEKSHYAKLDYVNDRGKNGKIKANEIVGFFKAGINTIPKALKLVI